MKESGPSGRRIGSLKKERAFGVLMYVGISGSRISSNAVGVMFTLDCTR
jgi:hypothetical protein